MTLLRIDSSANLENSITRDLTDRIITTLGASQVITRDLARTPLPQIDADWSTARLVPAAERGEDHTQKLALSDRLIDEIQSADTLVIGLPVYNFSVPASLKAWIDLVARPGLSFRYTEKGPEGLIKGKRALIAMASGGTAAGSNADFASPYLTHFLRFIGFEDIEIIAADAMALDPETTLARANADIAGLKAAA